MADGLIKQAQELGGVVSLWQGEIQVRVPARNFPDQYWVLSFHFSSYQQLAQIMTLIEERKFEPFSDVINLKVNKVEVEEELQEDGPSCPYHGDKFIKDSIKVKGQKYCSAKLKDGSYCKWTSA